MFKWWWKKDNDVTEEEMVRETILVDRILLTLKDGQEIFFSELIGVKPKDVNGKRGVTVFKLNHNIGKRAGRKIYINACVILDDCNETSYCEPDYDRRGVSH